MREMIRLLLAVLAFSAISGGVLAAVRNATQDRIELQKLTFVKGPTIREILEGCANDPLVDRFKIKDGDVEREFYVGEFDGHRNIVAFESFGKGFGGDIGVIVAINLENDEIYGMGVTTLSETPGVGSRVKTDAKFKSQFKGLTLSKPFKVKADGGDIDAVSGATVSSRGVCAAVNNIEEIYGRLKTKILEKAKM